MKLNSKKGISLIVLVITIIVMIILAAAIILSLQSSGVIDRANEAKEKSDNANLLEAANITASEWELEYRLGNISDTAEDYITGKLYDQGFISEQVANLNISENGEVSLKPNWDNTQAYLFDIDSDGVLKAFNREYIKYNRTDDGMGGFYEDVEGYYKDKEHTQKLTEATIPNTVTSIAPNVFEYGYDIEIINLPEGLKTIQNTALCDCGVKNVTVPSTVTSIGTNAFAASSVETITILSENVTFGSGAFGNCSYLLEIKVKNDTVKSAVEACISEDENFMSAEGFKVTIIQ